MIYSPQLINEFREVATNDNLWSFLDELLYLMNEQKNIGSWDIHLNGGRKSGKTYRALDFVAKAIIMLKNNVDAYLFRWLRQDSEYLFNEVQWQVEHILGQTIKPQNINLSRRIIKINGNLIQTLGVHSSTTRKKVELAGLTRAKGKKYCILVLEECYEFSESEILDIKHAVGGYDNFITIYISNPNTLDTPYLQRIHKVFEHNENELKTKGYQFLVKDKVIYFYNNWRINNFLSDSDIKTISDTWEIDKERAKVVDWGIPGVESGVIYANELRFINIRDFKDLPRAQTISVGIDWGDGDLETSSATTLMILGIGNNNADIVLKEYYWHNKWGYKSVYLRAKEMLSMVKDFFSNFDYKYFRNIGVDIILDTGLYSERDILELVAAELGISSWVSFKFALKNLERTRINIRKYKLATNRYYVNKECIYHLQELNLQKWDLEHKDKQGLPKQLDSNNHTTDALDYAISYNQYDITKEDTYKLLYTH